MNQSQRNFLIKKIEDTVKAKIDSLESSKRKAPSINNYLLHAVMSGNFEIKSTEEIKAVLLQKALQASGNEDWLGNHWGMANKSLVAFKADEIFVLPSEFKKLQDDTIEYNKKIYSEIHQLKVQSDSLITRIQLASDKTLQKMINEVDDMGDISLFDTKLKLANGSDPMMKLGE